MPENPGVSRVEPAPEYGRDKPISGGAAEPAGQKPFSLPEGPEKAATQQPEPARPSPMEVAGDASKQSTQIPPEELHAQISNLRQQMGQIRGRLQDQLVTQNFTTDHYEGLKRITEKLNPDMQTIAKNSNGQFTPPPQSSRKPVLEYVTQWLSSSQGTLSGALNFLQDAKRPDIMNYLRLQYAVQRAVQKGELFAGIVGSSVSGIKTILSTQLG